MRIRNFIAAAVVTAASFLVGTGSAHAATEMQVQYQNGSRQVQKFAVESFTWGVLSNPGLGRAALSDVTFSIAQGSSPEQDEAVMGMLASSALSQVVLQVQTTTSAGTVMVTYTFQGAMIVGTQETAGTTNLTMVYESVLVTSETEQPTPINPPSGWNRTTNNPDPSSTGDSQ